MTPDQALANRVKAVLGRITPDVEERKMFGAIAFMVRGKMCVCVGHDRLMCRIDPSMHDLALERKGCRTVVMRGRQYQGYVHVEAQAVQSTRALSYWIGLSVDHNEKAASPSRKRRRPRRAVPG